MSNLKIAIFALSLALPLGVWALTSRHADPLQAEAQKVFEFDHAHPHRLPAHLIRTLSLVMEFQDADGARKLIQQLQRKM